MPLSAQPPITVFTKPFPASSRLPLPTGSSQTPLAVKTCVRLKSERERSPSQLRMLVGVRELVVVRPPPDDAPTGSTDWLSIDLPKVYAAPNRTPFSNRLRSVNCAAW